MSKIRKFVLLTAALACCSLLPPAKCAIFNTSIGFDVYGTMDDNILLMSEEEIKASKIDPDDRILQIHPYIQIVSEGTRSSVIFKYEYFREWYEIHHPLDRTDNSFHDGRLLAKWDATDNLTLELEEIYIDSLYGLERAEVPEIRDDYWANHLIPAIMFHHDDSFELRGSFFWNLQNYDEPPIYVGQGLIGYADWDEIGGNIRGEISLNTDTSIFAVAEIWQRKYDDEFVGYASDADGYNVSLGVTQKLGANMNLQAYAQFTHRAYENPSTTSGDDSYDHFGGFVEFTDQFTGYSRLTIQGFSRFVGSERISSAFYRDTGAKAEFFTVFGKHIETAFKLHYSVFGYDNVEETWKDDFFKAAVTVGYRLKEWFSIRGQYQYSIRESEHEFDDFENNLISIYLHFFFDFYR